MNGGHVVPVKNETSHCSNSMPRTPADANLEQAACCIFEIRVQGQLSDLWADWFEGLTIQECENGVMVLSGPIVDQSALMGVLNKLNRLNLKLLSINEVTQHKKETK